MLEVIRRQLLSVRGLNTVPGAMALALWALSVITLWVDYEFPEFATSQPFRLFYTDYDTAKSVLSTIAAASITTLGLVYSIVLVVFTTAAGNIGPRLLQRFTDDRVNQFTAGLFGGTFLFSLTVLHQTDAGFVPSFSIAGTFFLAGLSVLQLIYFVHSASVSVTVDEEVAAIASRLEADIDDLVEHEDSDIYSAEAPGRGEEVDMIKADKSGYITDIDVGSLVSLAREHDLFISLRQGLGDFVIPGLELAALTRNLDGETRDKVEAGIHSATTVWSSRSPQADIGFSINLLIEIALRALSPGVNDTYTAVACIDRISSALVRPVRGGMRDRIRADEDRVPRLYMPGMTIEDLLNTTFHPVRRAAVGNILMTMHILDALGRLYNIGDPDARKILKHHADLVVAETKKADLLPADLDFVVRRHARVTKPG